MGSLASGSKSRIAKCHTLPFTGASAGWNANGRPALTEADLRLIRRNG